MSRPGVLVYAVLAPTGGSFSLHGKRLLGVHPEDGWHEWAETTACGRSDSRMMPAAKPVELERFDGDQEPDSWHETLRAAGDRWCRNCVRVMRSECSRARRPNL